jgi:23S rRNA pseudouridine2605 synthase
MPRERRIGLARALSKLGYCSRSKAFELIRDGHVKLNGRVRRDPETPVNEGNDKIEVDGQPVSAAAKVYLMMNKPRGVVTTAADEQGRKTVLDLLNGKYPFIAPVGRLDKASEGLLLLTNDSEWAARITQPKSHLAKMYHVQVGATLNESLLRKMEQGIASRGERLRVQRARIVRRGEKTTWIEVVLDEGRNRQIRRICDELELEVLRLIRIAIGPLSLGELAKSACRPLTAAEKSSLDLALNNLATS